MRKMKVIGYWTATAVVTFELILGVVMSLVHGRNMLVGEPLVEVMQHLGYPLYLLTILGVCKPLAGIVLLVPGFPRLKEWAYAGSFVSLIGALVSDALCGYDVYAIFALGFAVLTLVSWALRPQSRTLGVLFPAKPRNGASAQDNQATSENKSEVFNDQGSTRFGIPHSIPCHTGIEDWHASVAWNISTIGVAA